MWYQLHIAYPCFPVAFQDKTYVMYIKMTTPVEFSTWKQVAKVGSSSIVVCLFFLTLKLQHLFDPKTKHLQTTDRLSRDWRISCLVVLHIEVKGPFVKRIDVEGFLLNSVKAT